MQKRLFDIDWSDESKCQACYREEGTGSNIAQIGTRSDVRSQGLSESGSKKRAPQKEEWKWQTSIVTHPLCGSQRNEDHFSMKKWELEKHKSQGMPAASFKGHVAADGSLLGTVGKW